MVSHRDPGPHRRVGGKVRASEEPETDSPRSRGHTTGAEGPQHRQVHKADRGQDRQLDAEV